MNISKSTSTGGTRSVAAFYETRMAAETAKAAVIETGVSPEAVKITDAHGTVTGASASTDREGTGFIDTIKHAFAQDQQSDQKVAQRPGFVVTVHAPSASYDAVHEVLVRDGKIADV